MFPPMAGEPSQADAWTGDAVLLPTEFLADLAAANSVDDVLDAASTWLRRIVVADRASVTLLDESARTLQTLALGGNTAIPLGAMVPVEHSLAGAAIRERRIVTTPDLEQCDASEAAPLLAGGIRSVINAPLVSSDICFGTVNIGSREPGFFEGYDTTVLTAVSGLMASYIAVHEQVRRQERLAERDELTGLLNRRAILDAVNERFDSNPEAGIAILFVDLDGFKLINDAYGHASGDALLRELADRFRRALRPDDVIGRTGGDEFLVLLGAGTDEREAMSIASRVHETCVAPVDLGAYVTSVGASVGVAHSRDAENASGLLAEADFAMYHAKRSEAAVVPADDRIRAYADLVSAIDRDIEQAIVNGHLRFDLQPVRRLADREILGCEALLRWHHPVHGSVPAPLVMERIEAKGHVARFTEWSIGAAASALAQLRSRVPAFQDKAIALNLTARQLGWAGYTETHMAALDRNGLRPEDVIIELVESGLIEVGTAAERTLRELGQRSVIIALDDFGTGHNVLGYFAQFPIHSIKFDRSLIDTIDSNEPVRAIVRGLAQVARDLGIDTLAEGIERPRQADRCREVGIVCGQGLLLGGPAPVRDFERLALRELHGPHRHRT